MTIKQLRAARARMSLLADRLDQQVLAAVRRGDAARADTLSARLETVNTNCEKVGELILTATPTDLEDALDQLHLAAVRLEYLDLIDVDPEADPDEDIPQAVHLCASAVAAALACLKACSAPPPIAAASCARVATRFGAPAQ